MVRAAEFGTIRLPRGTRTGAILTLGEAHLSVRAIASALGIGVGPCTARSQRPISRFSPATTPSARTETGPRQRVRTPKSRQVFQMEHRPSKTGPNGDEKIVVAVDDSEEGVPNGTPGLENEPESIEPEPISDEQCHIYGSHIAEAVCSVRGARAADIAISHGVSVEMVFAHPEKFDELGHAHPDSQWGVRKLEDNKARILKLKEHRHVPMRKKDMTPQQKLFAIVNHAVTTDGITDLDQIAADNDLDPDLVALIWSKSWKLIGEGFCPVCRKPCHDPCPSPNHAAHDPCRR